MNFESEPLISDIQRKIVISIFLMYFHLGMGIKIFILGAGFAIYSIGMRVYRNTSLPPY